MSSDSQRSYKMKNSQRMVEVLNMLIQKAGLSQTDISTIGRSIGSPISQSTISNLHQQNGNKNSKIQQKVISVDSMLNILDVLNVTPSAFFSMVEGIADIEYSVGIQDTSGKTANNIEHSSSVQDTVDKVDNKYQGFITNIEDSKYNGYFGLFHVYFFPTQRNSKLLHGVLNLEKRLNAEGLCHAEMILDTGVSSETEGKTNQKTYIGGFIFSNPLPAAYGYLVSNDIGEITFFNFDYFKINQESLQCRLAVAVTTSSGALNSPTVHRMFLCRKELSLKEQKAIKGHLRLNDSNIIIPEKRFKDIMASKYFSTSLTTLLENVAKLRNYYVITESHLKSDEEEFDIEVAKAISELRDISIAPEYSKIWKSSDQMLFSIYKAFSNEENSILN